MSDDIWGELIIPSSEVNSGTCPSTAVANRFPVRGKKFVIGRAKDCDLHLQKKQISSRHCYLTKDDDNVVWLHDTSLNGTFINKEIKVANGNCHEIHDGDALYLVHKKKNLKMDYYLTFQLRRTAEADATIPVAGSSTSFSKASESTSIEGTTEPPTKKMKLEFTINNCTANVKQEPLDDDEHTNNQTELCDTNSRTLSAIEQEHSSSSTDTDTNHPKGTTASNLALPKREPVSNFDNNQSEPDNSAVKYEPFWDDDNNDVYVHHVVESKTQVEEDNALSNDDSTISCPENNDAVTPNETGENKSATTRQLSAVESSISSILQCSLCLEILHDPVCLQPCMHCYCSGCYSRWMDVSDECPQCRSRVQKLCRNHLVGNLIDAYLKDHPEKKRSLSEIDRLNALNTITADMLNAYKNQPDSNSSSGDDDDTPLRNVDNCRQCPQQSARTKKKKKVNDGADQMTNTPEVNIGASTSNSNATAGYRCPPGQLHAICNCCYKSMPDRRNEQNVPAQQCTICKLMFCHLYWVCQKPGCSGCLNKFSDMNFTERSLEDVLNKNRVETQILFNCLKSQRKNSKNLVEECLSHLDDGTYKCILNLSSTTVLCYTCALRNLRSLVYSYRQDIPPELITDAVRRRPNCHWGNNCRTQSHNIAHAERYNHICEQTRFQ